LSPFKQRQGAYCVYPLEGPNEDIHDWLLIFYELPHYRNYFLDKEPGRVSLRTVYPELSQKQTNGAALPNVVYRAYETSMQSYSVHLVIIRRMQRSKRDVEAIKWRAEFRTIPSFDKLTTELSPPWLSP
jgi:hypothetical protein